MRTLAIDAARLSLVVLLGVGCGTDTGDDAGVDSGTGSDAGPDAGVDDFAAQVAALAEPLVDPSGADATRTVGVSVVVVSGARTEVFGFGATRAGGADAPDADTCFPLGSVSKVFTGLLLAAAIESSGGTLGPDDEVNAHLAADVRAPDFAGAPMTLEHLVSHYSSLPNFPDNMTGPMASPALDYSRGQLATFLSGVVLDRAPGTSYSYSNVGSGLLGVALADSAGDADYDALLSRALTGPLGMSDTGTNTLEYRARIAARLVQTYRTEAGSLVEVDVADMGVLAGGGEVLSTGDDLALLLRALTGLDAFPVAGAVERAVATLGPGAGATNIAYALDVVTRPDGGTMYEKAGITAGSTTFISFRRDPPVGAAILSSRGGHMQIRDVTRQLVDMLAEP